MTTFCETTTDICECGEVATVGALCGSCADDHLAEEAVVRGKAGEWQ